MTDSKEQKIPGRPTKYKRNERSPDSDKKGLQKFTYLKKWPTELTERQRECLSFLVNRDEASVRKFDGTDADDFRTAIAWGLDNLKFEDRDLLIETLSVVGDDERNRYWEWNHMQIRMHLSNFILKNHRLPTNNELSELTGLSRQTVHKHLKDFDLTDVYKGKVQQYKLLATKVLDKLFDLACGGDTSAAKLYLQAVGGLPGMEREPTVKNQQNNFIQINGMVITEEEFKLLPEDLLTKIKETIKPRPLTTGLVTNRCH